MLPQQICLISIKPSEAVSHLCLEKNLENTRKLILSPSAGLSLEIELKELLQGWQLFQIMLIENVRE